MLSISVIRSSAAAASYYERDDYYAAEGGDPDAQGLWYGKGAAALGLAGGVQHDQFKAVLDGTLPNGVTLGTMRDGELQHRPGWDLTFSAPKSVSILAEVGGDERLFKAHDNAVRIALDYVEGEATGYRQRGFLGFRERKGDNLVAALFQHDTSRNQDPQLHTHAVVANVTQRPDGRWVSMHGDGLYTHKMAAGNVYRAALADQVLKLGYQIERVHRDGRFELTAVPENVAEAMSTRRAEIETALEKRGLEGAEASAQAAVMTRKAKTVIERSALAPLWQERTRSLGFDAEAAVKEARGAGDQTPDGALNLGRVVRAAADRLAEHEAVFTPAELVQWSLAGAMGRATLPKIQEAIDRAQRSGELQATRLDEQPAWTTPVAQQREKRYLASLANTEGSVTPALSSGEARAALQGRSLAAGQREAIELIVTSSDRFIGILGRPGVGKTYMLGHGREILEKAGFNVVGMAANSEAARQLQKDAGIESTTIHKHLAKANGDIAKIARSSPAAAEAMRAQYRNQVWTVDEASQLDSGIARRLTYAADRLGVRVVLVGDTQQLAAIGAGKPFDLMLKAGMKHVEMDELRRQKESHHLAAVRAAIAGKSGEAMRLLAGETVEIPDKDERLSNIISTWAAEAAGERPLVLTAKNAEKDLLNEKMRDVLRAEGSLRGERQAPQLLKVAAGRADLVEAEIYERDDVVRFGSGARSLGIDAHEYLRVVGSDRRTNIVVLERERNGKAETIDWNPRQVAGGAKGGVELFRPKDESTLAPGEKIQWSRNNSALNLSNGQPLTVVSVADGKMIVRDDSGEQKIIDTSQMQGRHWEHAYATTVYKSQGKTESSVIVNAESDGGELFNQKAFLVAISRQQHELKLVTDDQEALLKNIERHSGDKTSATESREQARFKFAADFFDRSMRAFQFVPSPKAAEAEKVVEKNDQRDRDNILNP